MATKEGDTDRSTDDGTLDVAADQKNIFEPPTGGRYLCSDLISTYYLVSIYDSMSTWYKIDDTKPTG